MRTKILIMILLLPMMAQAQITTVSESQKQQALQQAVKFCSLLTRWSNGERTLDSQIYALCSGRDCSAYDDITDNKETTMRNYMMGIQKKYPRNLAMQISQPSFSSMSISYEPELTETSRIGTLTNEVSLESTGEIIEFDVVSYRNAYVIFKVTLSYTTLGKTSSRLIVYDVNSQKITAFVEGQGTFMSYINGLNLMAKKDYKGAIPLFDAAASNPRASLKRKACLCAITCCAYTRQIDKALHYSESINDAFLIKYFKATLLFEEENFTEVLKLMIECEQMAKQNSEYKRFLSPIYTIEGLIYCITDETGGAPNIRKAVTYYKKAIEQGNVQAVYLLWGVFMKEDLDEDLLSGEEILGYIKWAAEKGHPAMILMQGTFEENQGKKESAINWFTKGANNGDPFCMARLGKLLLENGGSSAAKGRSWLQKALEGDRFEKYKEAYTGGLITKNFWPNTRADISNLLNGSNGGSSSSSSQSATPAPNSTVTSSGTSGYVPSSTSGSSYHRRKYRRHFNHRQDRYVGGFSAGYIQKQWVYKEDGEKEKMGMFDDDKYLQGIQTGFRIDPQFGAGIGIHTGIFYEYCWAKSKEDSDSYGTYHYTYEEHGLYAPAHLKFTMNFSKWFQLSVYGGAGFNYLLSSKVYLRDDGETYNSADMLSDDDDWERFNIMWEYGAALRIKAFQINFTMSQGITKWPSSHDQDIKQNRPMSISASICF